MSLDLQRIDRSVRDLGKMIDNFGLEMDKIIMRLVEICEEISKAPEAVEFYKPKTRSEHAEEDETEVNELMIEEYTEIITDIKDCITKNGQPDQRLVNLDEFLDPEKPVNLENATKLWLHRLGLSIEDLENESKSIDRFEKPQHKKALAILKSVAISSVAVERAFSVLSNIATPHRIKLGQAATLQKYCFIACNRDLVLETKNEEYIDWLRNNFSNKLKF